MLKRFTVIILFFFCLFNCLTSSADGWNERRSNHFIVYYKQAPEDFIESAIDAAEDYYHSITRELGFTRYDAWAWDNRAEIYIYDDKDDYLKTTKQPSWSGGHTSSKEKRIATFPLDSGFFDTLLPHELGHIIFREFVGFKSNVPLWLEEGIASCQEKARRFGSVRIVKQALINKKLIPLTELAKMNLSTLDKDSVDLFYAESASVVNFLLTKFNRANFVDFCEALKQGKSFDVALYLGYPRFQDLTELNREWIRYLENE